MHASTIVIVVVHLYPCWTYESTVCPGKYKERHQHKAGDTLQALQVNQAILGFHKNTFVSVERERLVNTRRKIPGNLSVGIKFHDHS
jgi:hypothetical protein